MFTNALPLSLYQDQKERKSAQIKFTFSFSLSVSFVVTNRFMFISDSWAYDRLGL